APIVEEPMPTDRRTETATRSAVAPISARLDLDHIRTWIFDLDNTLYHPSAGLLDQINHRMTDFIMAELGVDRAYANDIRSRYWRRYGITLAGLMAHHGTEPSRFLDAVHDIDLSAIAPEPALIEALAALRARPRLRLIVHTNGARAHARRVLAQAGLADAFDAIYALEDKGLAAKPDPAAYAHVIAADGIDTARAAMVEDSATNLVEPKRLGMATIWVTEDRAAPPAHIDLKIAALAGFLAAL
ncbi:MAG: pyrimidine 5'-nucleotidase, partial [Pseudomonadota bacterium]